MKLRILVAMAALVLTGGPAAAAGLCNCCGASTAANCTATCAPLKPAQGQCVAAVDYEAAAQIGAGVNPLYDMSLRGMWLGTPSRSGLEAFRKLLERSRKGAEKDRRAALRAYRHGRIDAATAKAMAKRYDDAIVNYYLGMKTYRAAISSQ